MSEANEKPAEAPEPTLIEQNGDVPETVIPDNSKDAPEKVPEEAPEPEKPAAEAANQEQKQPKRTPWYQTRIDEITKARREAEKKAAELEAKLAERSVEPPEAPAFDPQRYEQDVQTAAQRIIENQRMEARKDAFLNAGNKEYGAQEFLEKCNEVAMMGAGDSPEFFKIITDPEILPDGHRIVAQLAESPEDAQRILALKNDPVRMAAALTRFGQTVKAPEQQISKAPPPTKPIGGSAKSSAPEESDDIQTWMAKRKAEVAARQGR